MIFTWDWKNTCVVYKWWHVKTFGQFLATLVAIALLGGGYEFIKYWFAKWEQNNLGPAVVTSSNNIKSLRIKRSIFYGFQVGYSFMLMLVFMTYNGWYMIAVVFGAIFGHYLWGSGLDRSLACH